MLLRRKGKIDLRCSRKDATGEGQEDLPAEVYLQIFQFLNERDLANCSRVCWYWYAISADCSLWRPLFVRRFGMEPAPHPQPELSDKKEGQEKDEKEEEEGHNTRGHVKAAYYERLCQLKEEEIQQRINRWTYHPDRSRLPKNVVPVLRYKDGQVQEVYFISGWHALGYVGWLAPALAAYYFGFKPALISTCVGTLLRLVTYDAYIDEEQREKRPLKVRMKAVGYCLLFGLGVSATAACLGWISPAGPHASLNHSISTLLKPSRGLK
jgi:hypothetical protein